MEQRDQRRRTAETEGADARLVTRDGRQAHLLCAAIIADVGTLTMSSAAAQAQLVGRFSGAPGIVGSSFGFGWRPEGGPDRSSRCGTNWAWDFAHRLRTRANLLTLAARCARGKISHETLAEKTRAVTPSRTAR
jgi:hypothetical protein